MNLPYMTAATGKNRKQIIAFAGLNYGQGAGDGELAESWGLSSARFPCLSQRDGRKTAGTYTSPTGLYARGKLCVVDGTDFLYDGKVVGPAVIKKYNADYGTFQVSKSRRPHPAPCFFLSQNPMPPWGMKATQFPRGPVSRPPPTPRRGIAWSGTNL